MIEMNAVVIGKVQGVMYRTYVQEVATNLGLVGYTKNASDGSVIVVAQGLPDVLKEFVEYLHEKIQWGAVFGLVLGWGAGSIQWVSSAEQRE